jgi:signal transduction histidine kinase
VNLPTLHQSRTALLFSLAFFAIDWLSYIHPLGHLNITPWNPPAAVEVLFLFSAGISWMAWVYITLAISDWLVRGSFIFSPAVVLGNAMLVLCYAGIAASLRSVLHGKAHLRDPIEVGSVTLITLVGALVTGCLYISLQTTIGALQASDFWTALHRFIVGDLLGLMIALPLFFVATDRRRKQQYRRMFRARSFQALMVGLLVCMGFIFSLPLAQQMKYFFSLFFVIGLIAAAHSLPGATLASALVQLPLVFSATRVGTMPETLLDMQILMLTLSLTGLIIGTVVDERMRAEERLRETLQLVAAGELAGSLAHELHQPMSALSAYAESALLLQAQQEQGRDVRDTLNQTLRRIVDETLRATRIVKGLRSFFTSGVSALQEVDAQTLIEDGLARVQGKADQAQVQLQGRYPDTRIALVVDPVQIGTALGNLLKNAIEASPAGATVWVELSLEKHHTASICVLDSGPLLTADEADQIFRPFYSQKKEGLGLGLSVSQSLVDNNDGILRYQDTPEKCFQMLLPTRELIDE